MSGRDGMKYEENGLRLEACGVRSPVRQVEDPPPDSYRDGGDEVPRAKLFGIV